jgi:hypothetical protein
MAQEQRPEDPRETLWGIKPADRPWFQTLTIVGGTAVAIINTVERLNGAPSATAEDPLLYRIATDIVTGYIAAGLTTWTLLYAKEVIVTLADVIRRKAQEREDRRVREAEERAEARAMEMVEARAAEMAEARAAEMANERAKATLIQLVDQLNRNEAGSSEVRFSREDLLQLLEEQSRNGESPRKPEE